MLRVAGSCHWMSAQHTPSAGRKGSPGRVPAHKALVHSPEEGVARRGPARRAHVKVDRVERQRVQVGAAQRQAQLVVRRGAVLEAHLPGGARELLAAGGCEDRPAEVFLDDGLDARDLARDRVAANQVARGLGPLADKLGDDHE